VAAPGSPCGGSTLIDAERWPCCVWVVLALVVVVVVAVAVVVVAVVVVAVVVVVGDAGHG